MTHSIRSVSGIKSLRTSLLARQSSSADSGWHSSGIAPTSHPQDRTLAPAPSIHNSRKDGGSDVRTTTDGFDRSESTRDAKMMSPEAGKGSKKGVRRFFPRVLVFSTKKKCETDEMDEEIVDPKTVSTADEEESPDLSAFVDHDMMSSDSWTQPDERMGVMTSDRSLAAYGDRSVATMAADQSTFYGGGSDGRSISSQGNSTYWGGGTTTGYTTSTFFDDASFYSNYGKRPVDEEIIDVFAPPGKLGLSIDTPEDGAPQVHAVKDTSCVLHQVKAGDRIIAIDDEDVQYMTAIQVSKMLSRRSANATRKITIARTIE